MDFYVVGIIIGIVLCIVGTARKDNGYSIFGWILPGDFITIAGAIILLLVWSLQTLYAPEDPITTDNCIPVTVEEKS